MSRMTLVVGGTSIVGPTTISPISRKVDLEAMGESEVGVRE